MRFLIALLFSTSFAFADGEAAGDFDYYVLSLSWSPTWCALEGEDRDSPQCDPDADFGWVMHGLWPQYEDGWPAYCPTAERNPPRWMTEDMADIMGTSGLAWYQWKKHGVCSGLSAENYYRLARYAYEQVNRPAVFRQLKNDVRLPASVVEEAFLKDNPDWTADMLTITCQEGRIQEARLCLTRDMEPRECGRDTVRDCTMSNALLSKIK